MGNFATQPDFATEASEVTPSDVFDKATFLNRSALYVGAGGDVSVIMQSVDGALGNAVIFRNVPAGTFLPAIVDYVTATNTTAASILAIK